MADATQWDSFHAGPCPEWAGQCSCPGDPDSRAVLADRLVELGLGKITPVWLEKDAMTGAPRGISHTFLLDGELAMDLSAALR